jgi:hypothetical protein
MNSHQRFIPRPKLPVEAAIVAGVFAILLYNFEKAAQHCGLLDTVAWVAQEILGSLVLLVWPCVLAYLADSSNVLAHLAHIVASIGPFFCGLLR